MAKRYPHPYTTQGGTPVVALLLLILAIAIFGVGAVVEGLLWMIFIGIVLLLAAGWFGWRALTKR